MSQREPATARNLSDEEFRQHALEILQRELGAAGLARFVRVYRPVAGDYTRDRRKWQHGITVDQIADEIKKSREKPA
jgi:hypothetical protein